MILRLRLILLCTLLALFLTACPTPPEPNTPPSASAETVTLAPGETSISLELSDLATDADGDNLRYNVGPASSGEVMLEGSLATYALSDTAAEADTFSYTVSDGQAEARAVITVLIEQDRYINTPPEVQGETLILPGTEDSLELDLSTLVTDDGPAENLSFSIITQPESGTLSLEGSNVTYTLSDETATSDGFTFEVTDAEGGQAEGTVGIVIEARDRGIARNDTFRAFNGLVVSAIPTANDPGYDIDVCDIEYDDFAVLDQDGEASKAEVVFEGESKKDLSKFNVAPSLSGAQLDRLTLPARFTFGYTLTCGTEVDEATVTLLVEARPNIITGTGDNYDGSAAQPGEVIIMKGSFDTITLGAGQRLIGGGGPHNRIEVDDNTELTYTYDSGSDGLSIQELIVTGDNVVGGRMNIGRVIGNNIVGNLRLQLMSINSLRIDGARGGEVSLSAINMTTLDYLPLDRNTAVKLKNIDSLQISSLDVTDVEANGVGIEIVDVVETRIFGSCITSTSDGAAGIRISNSTLSQMELDASGNEIVLSDAPGTTGFGIDTGDSFKLTGINNVSDAMTPLSVNGALTPDSSFRIDSDIGDPCNPLDLDEG